MKDKRNKICRNCKKEFLPVTYFQGKRLWQRPRPYCFECVPYKPSGRGKTFTKTRNTIDGQRQCRICKLWKDLNQFSPTDKFGNLNSYCLGCAAKKNRKPKQRFKEECIAYKGGKCIKCGYSKCPAALEFHHRNPKEKEFSFNKLTTVTFTGEIKKEIDKCDCLCSNCHKEIHYSLVETEIQSCVGHKGKKSEIINNKKQCIVCAEFKNLNEFSLNNKKTGNVNSYCKICAAKRQKNNKQSIKEQCILYNGGKCIKCGYNKCIGSLEFHHRDPQQKDFQLSYSGRPFDKLKPELDKCDCLCSRCHKEAHYLVDNSTK